MRSARFRSWNRRSTGSRLSSANAPGPVSARAKAAVPRRSTSSTPPFPAKNPLCRCTSSNATSMSPVSSSPKRRVRMPRINATPPTVSRRLTTTAASCGAGTPSEAKKPPTPPTPISKSFCCPCITKTIPTTIRSSAIPQGQTDSPVHALIFISVPLPSLRVACQPGQDLGRGRVVELGHQTGPVERLALEDDLSTPAPQGWIAVPGQLDPIAIRIVQVDCLVGAVVGRAIDPPAIVEQALERSRQVPPLGVVDGEVIEPGRPRRWRDSALALPGIEPDVVMISTGREKRGLVTEASDELETETASIEVDRAIEISHLEVDMADAGSRRYGQLWITHAWIPLTIRTKIVRD